MTPKRTHQINRQVTVNACLRHSEVTVFTRVKGVIHTQRTVISGGKCLFLSVDVFAHLRHRSGPAAAAAGAVKRAASVFA